MPENYRFGGGAADSTITPIGALATLVAVVLVLSLPRKKAVVPFLLVAFLMPGGQTLVLGGLHLYLIRIVILFGCVRALKDKASVAGQVIAGGFNPIDTAFFCWAITKAGAFMILYHEVPAVVNQFAFLWDCLGGYLFLRFAIRDEKDIHTAAKTFALIAVICGACMLAEHQTLHNPFSFIAGRNIVPEVREGKVRSQGPFAHSILAGVFGATILPLMVRMWSGKKDRLLALGGMLAAMAMVFTAATSTALGAWAAGILGLALWPVRKNMRAVRWGIVFAILGLAAVMKAPVWFVLAHIDFVGGSSSYHRAMLVDVCIRHFWDWCLVGASNNQNWGFDMWDIQNEFVAEAFRGGLAGLVFFVMVISRSFGRLGSARKLVEADKRQAWTFWTLGAVVFAHVVAYFGSDYFDQTRFWWYATLAIVSAATAPLLAKSRESRGPETLHLVPDPDPEWHPSSLPASHS